MIIHAMTSIHNNYRQSLLGIIIVLLLQRTAYYINSIKVECIHTVKPFMKFLSVLILPPTLLDASRTTILLLSMPFSTSCRAQFKPAKPHPRMMTRGSLQVEVVSIAGEAAAMMLCSEEVASRVKNVMCVCDSMYVRVFFRLTDRASTTIELYHPGMYREVANNPKRGLLEDTPLVRDGGRMTNDE